MDVAHSSPKGGIARRCTRPIAGGGQNKHLCTPRVDHTEPVVPVQNGGSARGYLPTHSRSWPLWPPLGYGQRKQADRIFMQWRPQGERPDLPRRISVSVPALVPRRRVEAFHLENGPIVARRPHRPADLTLR